MKATMGIIIIGLIILGITFNITSSNAIPSKSDYLKYVGKNVDITEAYSEYIICNPTSNDITVISKNSNYFDWNFIKVKGNLINSWFEIKVNETYNDCKIQFNYTCKNTLDIGNGTKIETGCSNVQYEKCIQRWRWTWKKFNPIGYTFGKGLCNNIRIYGTYNPGEIAIDNVISFAGNTYDEYDWWNLSFPYRMNITIKSDFALSNFPVNVNVTYVAGKMNPDFSDLRFINSSGVNQLYEIESMVREKWALIWINITNIAIGNNTISMYYGYANALNRSNPNGVWIYYNNGSVDDFIDNIYNGCTHSIDTSLDGIPRIKMTSTINYASCGVTVGPFTTGSYQLRSIWIKASDAGSWDSFSFANETLSGNAYDNMVDLRLWDSDNGNQFQLYDGSGGNNWAGYQLEGTETGVINQTIDLSILTTTKGSNSSYSNATARDITLFSNKGVRSGNIKSLRYLRSAMPAYSTLYVREIRFGKSIYPYPSTTFGSEELVGTSPSQTIIIDSPLNNEDFWTANNIQFLFRSINSNEINYTMKAYLDGSLVYSNSTYINGTNISMSINLNYTKSYNFTVWINSSSLGVTSATNIFTVNGFEISDVTYDSIVYETDPRNYSITLRYNPDLVSNITSRLYHNATDGGLQDQQIKNATHIWNRNLYDVPLLYFNNTYLNFTIVNTVYFVNGSTATFNSSIYYQNVTFAYFILPSSIVPDASNYEEGEDMIVNLNAYTYLHYANYSAIFYFFYNGSYAGNATETSYSIVGNFSVFEHTFNTLSVTSGFNETRNLTVWLNVSYGGRVRNYFQTTTVDVYKMVIGECDEGLFNTATVRISFFNEKDWKSDTGKIPLILFTVRNGRVERQYSFNKTSDNATYTFCIYPNWAFAEGKIYMEYESDDSPRRPYYLLNVHFSDEMLYLYPYLLNSTYATYTNIYLYDENSAFVPDYYIRILKMNPDTTTYETLFIGKTDSNGVFPTFLEPLEQPYVFYVTDETGSIVYTSSAEVIPCLSGSCPPYEKHIYMTASELNLFDIEGVERDINFNETSGELQVTISDTSGISRTFNIAIYSEGQFGSRTLYYNSNVTSSSVLYTTILPNTTSEYTVIISLVEDGFIYPILTETVKMAEASKMGFLGVFLAMIITVSLEIGGLLTFGPVGGIIGGFAGLVISKFLFLVSIPVVGITSLLVVIIMVLYEVFKGD